jgi:hypothetical protein
MYRQEARIPANCPPGFLGRYNVLPGDTFYNIGFVRVYGSKLAECCGGIFKYTTFLRHCRTAIL